MTVKLASMKLKASYGEIGRLDLDWDKHQGYVIRFGDPGAGPDDVRSYATLSQALSAMARIARKFGN
jgi:hypothetical protein